METSSTSAGGGGDGEGEREEGGGGGSEEERKRGRGKGGGFEGVGRRTWPARRPAAEKMDLLMAGRRAGGGARA